MGFFSKALGFFLTPSLEKGCVDQYTKFLLSGDEFNTEVLGCTDVNYSVGAIKGLLEKYGATASSDNNGFCDMISIDFEGQFYKIFYFMHYARAINVGITVETEETDFNKIVSFLNEVNKSDILDQVGVIEQEGKTYIRVYRQFLNTPHVGTVETLAQGLRDLKTFATKISHLEFPDDEEWKKWASIKSEEPIENAHDFWFNHNSESCLKNFAATSKIIEKDDNREVRSMIDINSFGDSFYAESMPFIQGRIYTYSEFPYLTLMQVNIREGEHPMVPSINESSAYNFFVNWNAALHFAPCKIVYDKDESGKIVLCLLMSGLYADDCNTRTYIDFLCSLQKATGIMVSSVR